MIIYAEHLEFVRELHKEICINDKGEFDLTNSSTDLSSEFVKLDKNAQLELYVVAQTINLYLDSDDNNEEEEIDLEGYEFTNDWLVVDKHCPMTSFGIKPLFSWLMSSKSRQDAVDCHCDSSESLQDALNLGLQEYVYDDFTSAARILLELFNNIKNKNQISFEGL